MIGEWMRQRGNRKKVVLITKGGHPDFSNFSAGRLSRSDILGDMDKSLQALGTDYVDLYLLHRDDVRRPVEDIMETLRLLVTQGKTRAVGVSNWSVARIREANRCAKEHGWPGLAVSEIQWSLAECFPETYHDPTIVCMTKRQYDAYREMKLPVLAFSSQAGGFFSRAPENFDNLQDDLKRFATPENKRRGQNLAEFCRKHGYGKTAVSLCYLTDNRLNAAAIVGCHTLSQLEDSLTAAEITIRPEEADELIH